MDGKVILITGASSGIGEQTARRFAEAGARVAIAARRLAEGEQVAAAIRDAGGEARFFQTDVGEPEQVRRLVARTVETFGRIDFAFNNAGLLGEMVKTDEASDEDWDRVLAVNLSGVWQCMKAEIKAMLASGGGAIVNMSSIVGHRGNALYGPAYVASKHGVIGLTRLAALQYATRNIRVNAVAPGVIGTDMAMENVGGDEIRKLVESWHPMNRFGTTPEVADAVFWLCSEGSAFVNGHSLVIDGGAAVSFG